jgi:TPR repeat protein
LVERKLRTKWPGGATHGIGQSIDVVFEANPAEGAAWFRKGAELGNADCIWGLGQCYLDGRGVPQDSVMAYALFSASLDGVENPDQKKAMTERRDMLGKTMTAEQLKKAEPTMADWTAKAEK